LPTVRELQEFEGLTERQAEVARLLARGLSNRQIAARLDVSPNTARHLAQTVLEKLRLHSRKALGLRLLERARRWRSG
nr:response regulator transcription factor [Gemmatimonadota bacterium]NIR77002.1 response regulator transcription factor [Gemmatimonadota bacterium]NIT88925.1 response regulator transcription factor [Gemmatimonadota bacterium]NIU29357.1 response regulator transcription factor [Gemmatimonadota bacterium]NIU34417.1 hypothetical protein [Gemmatimonadota bacterium]